MVRKRIITPYRVTTALSKGDDKSHSVALPDEGSFQNSLHNFK
jgi:hypothetical protein